MTLPIRMQNCPREFWKIQLCWSPFFSQQFHFFFKFHKDVFGIYATSGKELWGIHFLICWHTFQNIILAGIMTIVGCAGGKPKRKHIAVLFLLPSPTFRHFFIVCALGSVLTWYLQVNGKAGSALRELHSHRQLVF